MNLKQWRAMSAHTDTMIDCRFRPCLCLVGFFVAASIGCRMRAPELPHAGADSQTRAPVPVPIAGQLAADADGVNELVSSEEQILLLTPKLNALNQSVFNLSIPDHHSRSLFATTVFITDLRPRESDVVSNDSAADESAARNWNAEHHARPTASSDLDLWQPMLRQTAFFEHAKFFLIRGRWTSSNRDRFVTDVGFSGLARTRHDCWRAVRAGIQVDWQRHQHDWKIDAWRLLQFSTTDRAELMFDDITQSLGLPPADLDRLTTSRHWRYAVQHYYPRKRAVLPTNELTDNRFFAISTAEHPGVSVVDIDQDGFDDLYVTVRWGKNLLLHNQRDGTFFERAQEFGLDVDGRSNAALFGDFDNDGDPDVIIARSLERSIYLVNENGKYVNRSAAMVNTPLPFETTSLSAADYNGDGLLDVYLATYHQEDISQRLEADLGNLAHRIHKTLSLEQSRELQRRYRAENRSYVNQVGPPNVLLKNVGDGRFELAPDNDQLAIWRNSFQASWSDYDQDGDPDLYVANDFAPDALLRNDGPEGFHDITQSVGISDLGFAMGVSWGDYDNDGCNDLYVSNMYSKAGLRITRQIRGIDPRIAELSQGNYLYRNTPGGFQLVSGLQPPALAVARAGWSWGGQFVDVNNDGFQDIYVSSGYFSAPKEFETDIDL